MPKKQRPEGTKRAKRNQKASRRAYVAALAPAVAFIAFLVYIATTPPQPVVQPPTTTVSTVGEYAPDFELNRITAAGLGTETFKFSSTRGKVVFVDFVFSWCPHCDAMGPIIKKLHDTYAGRGVVFVTVAGSRNSDERQTAQFLRKHEVSWISVYDRDMQVFQMYSVPGTPTYYVIDRSGRITERLVGEKSYEALAAALDRALG